MNRFHPSPHSVGTEDNHSVLRSNDTAKTAGRRRYIMPHLTASGAPPDPVLGTV